MVRKSRLGVRKYVLELGGFGVGLAGAAEEDLVVPAGCCVVGSVVLEKQAGYCVIC